MRKAAFGLAVGLGLLIADTHQSPADPGLDPLDIWLATHPTIANVMIWEFPPPTSIRVPPRRFIVWQAPKIPPDPGPLRPLGDNVFPDPIPRVPAGLTGFTLSDGFEAAELDDGISPEQATVPGKIPDWLPGGVKKSEYGAEILSWSKWPESAKEELRLRFAAYMQWAQTACALYADYASSGYKTKPDGFDQAFTSVVDLDPSPVIDPPPNLQPDDLSVPGVPWAMVSSTSAFALYVRHVAAQLAIEMNGCVPWSALDYPSSDLTPLFDGRTMFRYVVAGPSEWGAMTATGYVVTAGLTPAPPLVVLGFLAQNALIGSDRTDTVVRLFEWERTHLRHVTGGTPTVAGMNGGVVYWGYDGRPPVSRMINGTVMASPLVQEDGSVFFDPALRNWVGGCGAASPFNAEVLRTVNIAAHRTLYAHFQNRFALDDGAYMGIGHADDPYGLASAPEIPEIRILIDDATFHEWFVNENDSAARLKNVARRVADLYLEYLPMVLLQYHCYDLFTGKDHASSRVYNYAFSASYTVAEMETKGLWTGLEAKLASMGGCAALGY